MKTLFTLLSLLFSIPSFSQWTWGLDFETSGQIPGFHLSIDTASNPDCAWQVGHPDKTVFTAAHSGPNVIVTDTVNAISPNDTSIFYLKHHRNQLQPFHVFEISFWYKMDGDSTDYGKIEVSPDTGHTWVDVMSEDTTYDMAWPTSKPSLNGSAPGWTNFRLSMVNWASAWGSFPVAMTADTILIRFTYITDSNSIAREGWMIDDIHVDDWYEGIDDQERENIRIYPSPASSFLTISTDVPLYKMHMQVYDMTGRLVMETKDNTQKTMDVSQLKNGLYLLRINDGLRSVSKKFVIQR